MSFTHTGTTHIITLNSKKKEGLSVTIFLMRVPQISIKRSGKLTKNLESNSETI